MEGVFQPGWDFAAEVGFFSQSMVFLGITGGVTFKQVIQGIVNYPIGAQHGEFL